MEATVTERATEPPARMPAGIGNAYVFQVFNTISFTIALGTPMILYFQKLGASATVLGILVALPPLLTVLQIPAATFVERVGYRSFVLRGWTLRSLFLLGIALVAALPDKIDALTRLTLMLFLLFIYNASRGVSLCGFLPWLTHLVPEKVRGRYLAGDQLSGALATLGTMLGTALYVRHSDSRLGYAVIFMASFVAAIVSLFFLRRIPDVPVPPEAHSNEPRPWKSMLLFPPFLKLLCFNFVVLVSLSGAGVFWVPLLRERFGVSDSYILGMMVVWSAVAAVSLYTFGRLIDRVGSRPVLGLAVGILTIHLACWGALAARLLPLNPGSIFLIQATAGVGIAAFNLANTRLAMATVPVMGRAHFFALFSVSNNVTLGMLPIGWGIVIDSLKGWQTAWLGWEWNPYSALYIVLAVIMLASFVFWRRLTEAAAMSTEDFLQELLVRSPARAVSRLLARRPFS